MFFQRCRHHFGLTAYNEVFTVSAQFVSPELRNGDVYFDMMRHMSERVAAEYALLPFLAEIPVSGTAHILNRATTDKHVFGILANGHGLVWASRTSNCLALFTLSKSLWKARVSEQLKRHRMTFVRRHSDHPATRVCTVDKKGLAVFATEHIKQGERIAVFEGEPYISKRATELPNVMRDHAIQTGPITYIHGEHCLAQLLNHSCEGNCGIRGLTEVFAARDIQAGEELTWCYALSEDSDWVLENCACGSDRCERTVKGFSFLPIHKQVEFFERNMISDWIRQKHASVFHSCR
jgi:hypothetical protein